MKKLNKPLNCHVMQLYLLTIFRLNVLIHMAYVFTIHLWPFWIFSVSMEGQKPLRFH